MYSKISLRDIKEPHGVVINGCNINSIRYVDDAVLIAETEKDLQYILNKVLEQKVHWSLNAEKIYVMTVAKKSKAICSL